MSEKLDKIIKEIEGLTVVELADLVKELEEKFGVKAQATVAAAAPVSSEPSETVSEKSTFNVMLTSIGEEKIQVIKAVNELTGLGLSGAKNLVEKVPALIKENVSKAEAEEIKSKLEAVGATIELK
ncbi:MAG TPA: 50S ribosomal protein L7/L12 [Candidatus Paceibacterota bacterium]|jgi:large subunit ribosomal protein L7/L12|nr:50S ribosomal protein L7/L12 [Candidatus Paceibacterota bacterium]HRS47804.1 50S ribosomal protein L7/L12 [Candidatus Paceibacterota bacterium]